MARSIETHREKIIDFLTTNGIEKEQIVDVVCKLSTNGTWETNIEFAHTVEHKERKMDAKGYYVIRTNEDARTHAVYANDFSNGGWHSLEKVCDVRDENEGLEKVIEFWHDELKRTKEWLTHEV